MQLMWVLQELTKRGYVIKTNGAWHFNEVGGQLELSLEGTDKRG